MKLYDILSGVIEQDNQRMYETVGQPAPNTVTTINDAETAIGFEPVGDLAESAEAEQAPAVIPQT